MTLTRALELDMPYPLRRMCWRKDLTLRKSYTGMHFVTSDKPNQPYLLTVEDVEARDWGYLLGDADTGAVLTELQAPPDAG